MSKRWEIVGRIAIHKPEAPRDLSSNQGRVAQLVERSLSICTSSAKGPGFDSQPVHIFFHFVQLGPKLFVDGYGGLSSLSLLVSWGSVGDNV